MEFQVWEPVYERILAAFGFERAADERARDRLASMTEPFDLERLAGFEGATVAIAGAGPPLAVETRVAAEADRVVAASSAADVLTEAGVEVDLAVTDLDKNPSSLAEMSHEGTPVAAHAHGDNIPAIEEWGPEFADEQLLPTTQAEPVGPVRNFGGFTDGDRGAFLADALGAAELRFPGWAFDDPTVDPMKAQKLRWAERLLYWLETRRDEQFPVLDGRRDRLTLPVEES
ncbi:MAG: 6-hydroxymethylpterin diphosphokinase MptE-like protein [Halolamina sp.]|uniref:6-hydroxymethylpterin diphosphokinase MptE-like protein n=1 Tax=Halolamina sp. TaxID=1940283 RepID=UPI002FC2DAC9